MNSDLNPSEEKLAAESQFARFASVCRTFAPMYRQMTVSAVIAFTTGADLRQPSMVAFRDVLAAWRKYMATRNNGRPFVPIGHSQGSLLLQLLITHEIQKKPAVS